jgi:hypothetical protein
MFKIRKAGLAIVMSLMLSLTLLVSGVSAQSIASEQNTVSTNPSMTAQVASHQSSIQPVFRVSDLHNGRPGNWHRGRRHGLRCYWTWRGWGRWRRWVRVCTRW